MNNVFNRKEMKQKKNDTPHTQEHKLPTIVEVDEGTQTITKDENNQSMSQNIATDFTVAQSNTITHHHEHITEEIKVESSMDPYTSGEGNKRLFGEEQKADPSLQKYFSKAHQGDFRRAKNGRLKFYIKDQILLRYSATHLRSIKQLVVPKKFRLEVIQTGHDSIFAGHIGTAKT